MKVHHWLTTPSKPSSSTVLLESQALQRHEASLRRGRHVLRDDRAVLPSTVRSSESTCTSSNARRSLAATKPLLVALG